MRRFNSPTVLLFLIAVIMFVVSLVMLLAAGIGFGTSFTWNVLSSLDVNFDLLPNTVITNPFVLAASFIDSLIFALLAVTFAAMFYEAIKHINIHRRVAMSRINRMKQHVILVPYNNFAHHVSKELKAQGIETVVITDDENEAQKLYRQNALTVVGSPKDIETFNVAQIGKAKYVIACSDDDIDNALITVTAKSANARAKIISRVTALENISKIGSAGAYRMIMPEVTAGEELGREIVKKLYG